MLRRLFYGTISYNSFSRRRCRCAAIAEIHCDWLQPARIAFLLFSDGLAKVISEATPMQAQVQPYAGTSTFVPLFESGELDLGVVNAVDMGMVYQGQKLKIGGRNPFPHVPSSRLLWRGSPLRSSLIVRKDSPIKTIADVKRQARHRRVSGAARRLVQRFRLARQRRAHVE